MRDSLGSLIGVLLTVIACSPDNHEDTGGKVAQGGGGATSSPAVTANGGTLATGTPAATANGGSGATRTPAATASGGTFATNVSSRTSTGGSAINAQGGVIASSITTQARGGASGASCGEAPGQLFGSDYPFNQKVDQKALDSESAAIISYLQRNHTDSRRFRADGPSEEPDNLYGIVVLSAEASTPRQSFTPTDEFYSPDCDPAPIPVPASGAIEGESGYACNEGGDCHLIVLDRAECRLYEMWRANRSSATSFEGGCQAIWDLRAAYQPTLRGDCCTSADAAGLPIAAQMFSADDIAAGHIDHAIRFILPNEHIRERIYVRPATHSSGSSTSGPADAPPYGTRMRLKASFDESQLKPAAQVVARALKQYGMILSDGGNLTFTATNDRFTTHKWAEVDFGPGDMTSLQWNDFEVPELGTRYTWDNDCNCDRTPLTQ